METQQRTASRSSPATPMLTGHHPPRTNTHATSLVPHTPCGRRADPRAHRVGYPAETPLPPPVGCRRRKCPPPSAPRAPPVWSPAPPAPCRDTRLPRPWGRPGNRRQDPGARSPRASPAFAFSGLHCRGARSGKVFLQALRRYRAFRQQSNIRRCLASRNSPGQKTQCRLLITKPVWVNSSFLLARRGGSLV